MADDCESNEATFLLHHQHTMQEPPISPLAANSGASRTFSRSVSDYWDDYVVAVEKHPLVTKSATATIIFCCADLCAQGLEHVRGTSAVVGVNRPRAARFAAFGLFGAPWSHFYFQWLDHFLPPTVEPWTFTTAIKVCIDQFVQAPMLLTIMICALSLMKGGGIAAAHKDLGDTLVNALIANCKFALHYVLG